MQLVWANGPVTAEAVRERLSRPLKESTVRTVLRRLEDKGYTTHTVDGRTYVYQAAEPRGHVAAKAVQRIVDWFRNGSSRRFWLAWSIRRCSTNVSCACLPTRLRRQRRKEGGNDAGDFGGVGAAFPDSR